MGVFIDAWKPVFGPSHRTEFRSLFCRVPVIAQGGGVGGGFNSPYIALDGAPTPMYYAQPSAQTASYRPTGLVIFSTKQPVAPWISLLKELLLHILKKNLRWEGEGT